MKRTYSVSIPRSGHNWLAHMLANYFGADFHYCESYKQPELHMTVCKDTNFQKYHDFQLDLDPEPHQVLVQARRDIAAGMRSWREFEHSPLSYQEFAEARTDYWLGFMAKWWHPEFNRLLLWYEDLKANPVSELERVIEFLDTKPVDHDRVLVAVRKEISWPLLGLSEHSIGIDYSI